MAAILSLTIALPTRGLRADDAPAASPGSFHTHDTPTRFVGRRKLVLCTLSEISANLKALAKRLCPNASADDIAQETLARGGAIGAFVALSLGATIYLVYRQRGEARKPRPTAPGDAVAVTAADGTLAAAALGASATTEPAMGLVEGLQPSDGEGAEQRQALCKLLRSIARNVIREQWRKTRRVRTVAPEEVDNEVAAAVPSPFASVIADETAAQVKLLLEGLRPLECEVVQRHVQDGRTFPEIAAQLKISVAAVTKCWQRGVRRMRADARWLRLAEA